MANLNAITRRGILKAAPAAMVIGAGAALAAMPQSEIMRLMHECIALRAYINGPDSPTDDEWSQSACAALRKLEFQLTSIPARTAQEMAAKVLVWTAYASPEDVEMDCVLDPMILAEVRQLTGFSAS